MIKSFNNIKPVSGAWVALIGLLFGLSATFFAYFFNSEVSNSSFQLSLALGTISIILQALYFNKLCVDFDIIYTHTFIPAFFYVIVGCGTLEFLQLGIVHVYAWLFLLSLHQVIAIPNSPHPRRNIYMAAILLGLISLIIPFYMAAILVLLLSILVFKTIQFLDVLAVFSGFALPLLVVVSINLVGRTDLNYFLVRDVNFGIFPTLGSPVKLLIYPVFLFFLGALRSTFNFFKNTVQTRKMLKTVLYIFIFHAFILLLNMDSFYAWLSLMIIPLAVSFTYLHLGSKRQKLKSLSTVLLLLSLLGHLLWQVKIL